MRLPAIFRKLDCATAADTWASPLTPQLKKRSSGRWPGQADSSRRDVLPESFFARVSHYPGIALGRGRGALSARPHAQAPHRGHAALLRRHQKTASIEAPPQTATALVAAVTVDQPAAAAACHRAAPSWIAGPLLARPCSNPRRFAVDGRPGRPESSDRSSASRGPRLCECAPL